MLVCNFFQVPEKGTVIKWGKDKEQDPVFIPLLRKDFNRS